MVGAPHPAILGQGLVPGFQVEIAQQPSSPFYCRPHVGTQEATQERKNSSPGTFLCDLPPTCTTMNVIFKM